MAHGVYDDGGPGMQFDSGANTFGLPNRRMNNHGYNGAYYWDVPSAFFDYLAVKGKGKVVTEANVTALNGVPAVFRSVEKILYYYVDNPAQTGDGGGNNSVTAQQAAAQTSTAQTVGASTRASILPDYPGQDLLYENAVNDRRIEGATMDREMDTEFSNVELYIDSDYFERLTNEEFQEAGVTLWVRPTIAAENIDLDVLTGVASYTGFDDKGQPMLNSRVYTSNVRVKDGEEIVGGGFSRDRKVQITRKVPILGSIPVLGYLFGGEITTKKVNTVVEVLKASCVQNCGGLSARQQETIQKAKGELSVDMAPMSTASKCTGSAARNTARSSRSLDAPRGYRP